MPTLHHAGILTEDLEGTVAFYQDILGMQVCSAPTAPNKRWMRDTTGASTIGLEIVGPPFTGSALESYDRCGVMRDHLAFMVADSAAWQQKVIDGGGESMGAPMESEGVLEANVRHPGGLVIQFLQFADPGAAPDFKGQLTAVSSDRYSLHHFSLSAPKLDPLLSFFEADLGMKIVLDQREECQVFMADEVSIAARAGDTASIEVISRGAIDQPSNHADRNNALTRSKRSSNLPHSVAAC